MSTLTVAIGNSDDALSQAEWAAYWQATHEVVFAHAQQVFGVFLSVAHAPYQNAGWLVEGELTPSFTTGLAELAQRFRQESIAVAVGETTLVHPDPPA